jgi:hypothetical protein
VARPNGNDYAGVYVSDNNPVSHFSTRILGGVANNNVDYGLYADYPATGSGNSAIGNGSYDCYYVPCNAKVAGEQAILFEPQAP